MTVDEIIEAIDQLTVLQLVELKDQLQEKYRRNGCCSGCNGRWGRSGCRG